MSTTTHNRNDNVNRLYRTRWFMPAFALFIGGLMLGAFWIGDNLGQGLASLGVMAFVAALFYFGGRRAIARGGLASRAEWHGPGGPSGLQNRQAVVARRLEGSIPSPLRFKESLLSLAFRAGDSGLLRSGRLPLEGARNCPAPPETSPHSSPHLGSRLPSSGDKR